MKHTQPRPRPTSTRAASDRSKNAVTKTDLTKLEARMDRRFEKTIASFRTAIVDVSAKLDANHRELRDSIGSVRTDLANLSVNVFLRFQQIDDRFKMVDARFDGMDKKIESVRAELVGRIDQVFDHVGLVYKELTGRLGALETRQVSSS